MKGVTQMVLRTKHWKPIHEPGKVKPIYLTIYLAFVHASVSVQTLSCAHAVAFMYDGTVACLFDCANWSTALESRKSWEDRIPWTAYKMCNEYLSLFIFARFRYFNVSSPCLLWVSGLAGRVWRHATWRARAVWVRLSWYDRVVCL